MGSSLLGATRSAANPIQIENAKPGTDRWRLREVASLGEIEGYASATSVNRGETIEFFVSTPEPSYALEIFRTGWYNGLGGRRMTDPVQLPGIHQPMPPPDPATGMVEANWVQPYRFTIPRTSDPTDWLSGVYLAKLTAATTGRQSYIVFVVRDDERPSDFLFQSSVTTYQAYNNWGGKSLYGFNSTGGNPARKVSFNRPYSRDTAGTGDYVWQWEYNMVRFLEREGYDVSYATNIDVHVPSNRSLLLKHRGFLSIGHDEYWTWQMRDHVEHARNTGVSLGFFSANTAYWQIRLDPGSNGAPYRTMVGYKEQFSQDPFAQDSDLANDRFITTQFRNAPVNRPEEPLLGVMWDYMADHVRVDGDIVIENAWHWVFSGTGLSNGSHLPGLLGYEVDRMHGLAPLNTVRLAHSPYMKPDGPSFSDMTIYEAASGAIVFATGTIQWSWGLDDWNFDKTTSGAKLGIRAAGEGGTVLPLARPSRVNPAAQQITRNVLARMITGATPPRRRATRR